MHEVSNAINILDPGYGIDKKICYGSNVGTNNGSEHADDTKCATSNLSSATNAAGESTAGADKVGLWLLTSDKNTATKFASDTAKFGEVPNTTKKVAKDIRALDREQKGKVSSAFAKAHEGAEK